MERPHDQNILFYKKTVAFIEGKVSVRNIPEEIISDINISLKTDPDAFAQASRFVKLDEPFHFIVEPGEYMLECQLDQVRLSTSPFQVNPCERKVIHFRYDNDD